MKKIIAVLLIGILLAGLLVACAPSDSSNNNDKPASTEASENDAKATEKEKDTETEKSDNTVEKTDSTVEETDNTVKGKWVLTSNKVLRVRDTYTSDETTSTYSVELCEHTYEHKYTPDKEDPSDGPTPYTATFFCDCAIPETLTPGTASRFTIMAMVEHDDKPGHSDGMCCSMLFSGLTPEPEIKSQHGYDYSNQMYYPVCAGQTTEYGHIGNTTYTDGMDDFINVVMPTITSDMNPLAYETMTVTFVSNAGESEFVYTWQADS